MRFAMPEELVKRAAAASTRADNAELRNRLLLGQNRLLFWYMLGFAAVAIGEWVYICFWH